VRRTSNTVLLSSALRAPPSDPISCGRLTSSPMEADTTPKPNRARRTGRKGASACTMEGGTWGVGAHLLGNVPANIHHLMASWFSCWCAAGRALGTRTQGKGASHACLKHRWTPPGCFPSAATPASDRRRTLSSSSASVLVGGRGACEPHVLPRVASSHGLTDCASWPHAQSHRLTPSLMELTTAWQRKWPPGDAEPALVVAVLRDVSTDDQHQRIEV
jgi:hypothetical protein